MPRASILRRTVPFPPLPKGLRVPLRWDGMGEEVRQTASYRWDGLRRGQEGRLIWQYTLSGEGFIRIGAEKPVRLGPGTGFFARFPSDHCYYWERGSPPWRFLWMTWEGPALPAVADSLISTPVRIFSLDPKGDAVDAAAATIRAILSGGGLGDPWEGAAEAFRTLLVLARPAEPPPSPARRRLRPALGRVERALRSRPGASVGKEGLALELGLSRFQLYRAVRREAGTGPKEWAARRRTDKACRLLQATRRSVAEIAVEVGLPDANYFARFFRRRTGLSPRDWRRLYGKPD